MRAATWWARTKDELDGVALQQRYILIATRSCLLRCDRSGRMILLFNCLNDAIELHHELCKRQCARAYIGISGERTVQLYFARYLGD